MPFWPGSVPPASARLTAASRASSGLPDTAPAANDPFLDSAATLRVYAQHRPGRWGRQVLCDPGRCLRIVSQIPEKPVTGTTENSAHRCSAGEPVIMIDGEPFRLAGGSAADVADAALGGLDGIVLVDGDAVSSFQVAPVRCPRPLFF